MTFCYTLGMSDTHTNEGPDPQAGDVVMRRHAVDRYCERVCSRYRRGVAEARLGRELAAHPGELVTEPPHWTRSAEWQRRRTRYYLVLGGSCCFPIVWEDNSWQAETCLVPGSFDSWDQRRVPSEPMPPPGVAR